MFRTLSIALATLLATACAASDDGSPSSECNDGKCDDSAAAAIAFADDFTETVTGRVVAGASVRIDYDLDRLTTCRGSTGGSEVWGVSGFVQFDDGEPETFALSRLHVGRVVPVVATLDVPAGSERMTMWFAINNRWGCIAYDSNMDANYDFDVAAGAGGDEVVLDFAADFSLTQSGAVSPGTAVVVHYDPARLDECAGSSGGHAAWGITGHWQVDGGAVHDLAVTRSEGSELVAADPTLRVPAGADLALWFEATSIWGCHAWDSELGANYHVAIE